MIDDSSLFGYYTPVAVVGIAYFDHINESLLFSTIILSLTSSKCFLLLCSYYKKSNNKSFLHASNSNISIFYTFVFFYNSNIFSFIFLIIDLFIYIDYLLRFDFIMLYSMLLYWLFCVIKDDELSVIKKDFGVGFRWEEDD